MMFLLEEVGPTQNRTRSLDLQKTDPMRRWC